MNQETVDKFTNEYLALLQAIEDATSQISILEENRKEAQRGLPALKTFLLSLKQKGFNVPIDEDFPKLKIKDDGLTKKVIEVLRDFPELQGYSRPEKLQKIAAHLHNRGHTFDSEHPGRPISVILVKIDRGDYGDIYARQQENP